MQPIENAEDRGEIICECSVRDDTGDVATVSSPHGLWPAKHKNQPGIELVSSSSGWAVRLITYSPVTCAQSVRRPYMTPKLFGGGGSAPSAPMLSRTALRGDA